MRDRYLKEVRMEIKSKKQGESVPSKWKYRQLLNFIAPFAGTRSGVADICGNDDHNPDESGSTEGENAPSEMVKTPQSLSKVAVSRPDLKPQVAFVPQLPSLSQDVQIALQSGMTKLQSGTPFALSSKTGRKRQLLPDEPPSLPTSENAASPSKWVVKDNGNSLPNRPRDEDELFMLSFVPALKRLAPQKRCETKIKIQQIMFEAEFNVSQEKHLDSQRH